MFQAVPPPIIRSSKLYIQHRVLVKPLLLPAVIVEELELVREHTQTSSNSSTIAACNSKGLTNTRCCIYSFELLMMGGGTA
jgi:hypothetical protein